MNQLVVKVDWMLDVEDAWAVERRLRRHPAVRQAHVSPVSGVGVVDYDEARITPDKIRQMVIDCGYHCRVYHARDTLGGG